MNTRLHPGHMFGRVRARLFSPTVRRTSGTGRSPLRFLPALLSVWSGTLAFAMTLCCSSVVRAESDFPHDVHDGLFPSCFGCHTPTVEGGDMYMVDSSTCMECHDDDMGWIRPEPMKGLLSFDHLNHPTEPEECEVCHGTAEAGIVRANPEACFACHEVPIEEHFSTEPCQQCHRSFIEAIDVPASRLETWPRPAGHESTTFLIDHGAQAEDSEACQICHTGDSCARCHANADRVPAITALGTDERMAAHAQSFEGQWPIPPDHASAEWKWEHGTALHQDPDRCGTCHDGASCLSCHAGRIPGGDAQLFALLPMPSSFRGARPVLGTRPYDHTADWVREHRHSAGSQTCTSCHEEQECTDCHRTDGISAAGLGEHSGYHPEDYMVRHATDAYARDPNCADCHSTQVFCRDCHANSGLSPDRTRANVYHDAEPLWLLNHGDAARRDLESCASCHGQPDCLRCHSAKSGWQVSPHGNDFEADRLEERGDYMCAICHYEIPGKGK